MIIRNRIRRLMNIGLAALAMSLVGACVAKPTAAAADNGTAAEAGPSAVSVPASAYEGVWEGSLNAGGAALALKITISGNTVLLDVPAQNLKAFPASKAELGGKTIKIDFNAFKAGFEATDDGAGGLDGIWSQGGAKLPFKLHRSDAAAFGTAVKPAEPDKGEPVRFSSAAAYGAAASSAAAASATGPGVELAGTLRLPDAAVEGAAAGPFPAVILITGSGPQNRDEEIFGFKPFRELAEALAAKGWASLRYDDRGVGESTGNFTGALSTDFAADAVGAYRFLAADKRIDPKRIVLAGHSEGAYVACLAENELGGVHGLLLLAGAGIRGYDILLDQSADLLGAMNSLPAAIQAARQANIVIYDLILSPAEFPRDKIRTELSRAGLSGDQLDAQLAALADPWFRAFLAADPQAALRRLRSPVLALGGSKDLQVRAAKNLAAIASASAVAGVAVKTMELAGLNHLFQKAETGLPSEYGTLGGGIAPEALTAIIEWLGAPRADDPRDPER